MTQPERELLLLVATILDVVADLDESWTKQLRTAITAVERQEKEGKDE